MSKTGCILAGCFLGTIAINSAAQTQNLEQAEAGHLTVRVYNLAHVDSKTLSMAQAHAGTILAKAGLDVRWLEGLLSDPDANTADFSGYASCTAAHAPTELKLRILAAAPPDHPNVLGYALPCAKFGVDVTIYADRIEATLHNTVGSFPRILGHAFAHEIGHVLLRSPQHSAKGIMRATWNRADWQRAAVEYLVFTPEQTLRIRTDAEQD